MFIEPLGSFKAKITAFILFLSFIPSLSAHAEGRFSAPPRDLASYQSSLQSSLVRITCPGFASLGIVEKVGASSVNRIVTAAAPMQNCPKARNGAGLTITNLTTGTSVPGNLIQLGYGLTAEYSWLIGIPGTSPKILNERKGPILGEWLSVATVSPGASSITWFTSSIKSIDLTTSTLVIDNPALNIPNTGLVFDARGTFLGLVSSANQANSASLSVAGSPLRCKNMSETKIYSEVCLSDEDKTIERLSLWPDNSSVASAGPGARSRSVPSPFASDNPFGLKRSPDFGKRPIHPARPTTRPATSSSPSSKPLIVSCVKGKDVIAATGTPPSCPVGYRKK